MDQYFSTPMIWTSSNFGEGLWTVRSDSLEGLSQTTHVTLAMSSSGQYVAMALDSGYLYTNSMHGWFTEWKPQTSLESLPFQSVVLSADGSCMVAAYYNSTTGTNYTAVSSNYGGNWSQTNTTLRWKALATDATCSHLVGASADGYLYTHDLTLTPTAAPSRSPSLSPTLVRPTSATRNRNVERILTLTSPQLKVRLEAKVNHEGRCPTYA